MQPKNISLKQVPTFYSQRPPMHFSAFEVEIETIFREVALGNETRLQNLLFVPVSDVKDAINRYASSGFVGVAGAGARIVRNKLKL